jgi:hypothetical protein
MSTLILSGLGVHGVESLAFLRGFLCTPKPDTLKETRQMKTPVVPHNPLVFGLFMAISAFYAIGDNITVALQFFWKVERAKGIEPS